MLAEAATSGFPLDRYSYGALLPLALTLTLTVVTLTHTPILTLTQTPILTLTLTPILPLTPTPTPPRRAAASGLQVLRSQQHAGTTLASFSAADSHH